MVSRKGRGVNSTGRSKRDGQYLPIPYAMAHSAAFRSLSGTALKVWIELRARFNGSNNGRVSLSMGEAAELLGMSKTTCKRAFDELIDKGFLKLKRRGHWWGRRASEYTLTDVPLGDALATRDWQNWRPPPSKKQNAVLSQHATNMTVPCGDRIAAAPCRMDARQPDDTSATVPPEYHL